jgi:hypothetical protein
MRYCARLPENNNVVTIIVMTLSIVVNEETRDKRGRELTGEYYVNPVIRQIHFSLICIPPDKTDTESVKEFNVAYFCRSVRLWHRAVITSCTEIL